MSQLDFKDLLESETYLTVSQFTREIKFFLESSFPNVWLRGEISNFTHHSSGHMYSSLKDEDAQISCVMWESRNESLLFFPENGMNVIIRGQLRVFERRGNYQLDIWHMQPAGAGELQMAFEQLKNRLREEGLFSDEHKKPLPKYPTKIGVVTSSTGAAIQDLVTVMKRRMPAVEIILNPVRVQGVGAAKEIARAICEFNEFGNVDLLIVGRGGGSLEDLWPFNEEVVARAIFVSEIPIISAVGHEVDFSISDFVADLRAPTPSAAAEIAIRSREEIRAELSYFTETMQNTIYDKLKYEREKLRSVTRSYGFGRPKDIILQKRQYFDDINSRINRSVQQSISEFQGKLRSIHERLALLEHSKVLQRGYAVCYRDGSLINRAQKLQPEDDIEIGFFDGKALGTVNEVSSESN